MLQRTFLFTIFIALLLPYSVLNWCKDTTFKTGKPINTMVISPSGRYLAVAHNDNFVRIYQGSNYKKVGQYNVGYTINVMRFSNNGYYLAIGGASNSLTILNAYEPFTLNRTMAPLHTLTATNVVGLDFSNDSSRFIACGAATGGGRLSMYTVDPLLAWSPTTSSPLNMNPASNAAVDCRISPFNGQVAIVISSRITVYDPTLTTTIGTTTVSSNFFRVVFDPLAAQLVYIDLSTPRLMNWVIGGGAPTQLTGPSTALADNDFMFNGKYIAAGGTAKILYIYNGSRVSYERWTTTDVIKGVVFTRDSINPKLYAGDNSGQVLVLTMNCLNGGCAPSYYYTGTTCLFCGDAIDKCIDCFNGTICDRCVDGYFVDPNTNQCKVCPLLGCLVCKSSATCSECHSGFYLDSTTSTCKRCSSAATLQGCAVCSSSTVCLACNNDYWLSGSVCKNCSTMSNCLKCTNGTICTECVMGYYQNSGVCTACNANCLACTNTATNCSQCAKGWYVNTPTSYTCQRCSTGCLSCNNSNFCFQCQNGMYQKNDGTCATCVFPCINCQDASICYACSQGYYLSGTTCLPCTNNCATCNSTTYCVSCLAGYFFSGGSCTSCWPTYPNCEYCSSTACQSCQPGYFLNSSTLCQHCSLVMFKCQKCTSSSNCLSCIEGFYLTGANAANLSCKSCPTGCQTCQDNIICRKCYKNYYLDSGSNTCLSCTGNCLQCSDSSTCLVCDSGYYLDTNVCKLCSTNITNCLQCLNGSVCINCQVGYYLNSGDNKCYKCASNCVTCNSSKCFSCQIGYFLTTTTSITCQACSQQCTQCTALGTCTSCKAGFYLDSSTNVCKNCSHNRFCQTCNNITCYSCHYGYYLYNTIASPNYNCTRCVSKIQGCLHCNASNYCLTCDLGYYMDGLNICQSCTVIDGCQRCQDQNTCVGCVKGYFLNASDKCQICATGCSSCNPIGDCFTCYPGYYKSGTSCLTCKTNLQGCSLCSSSATCLQCMNGYFLSTSTSQCELCRSSIVGCLYCNDSLTCTNCQPGFYLDTVNDNCHVCDKNMAGCEICSSSSVCLDCEVGYYLTGGGGSGCTLCSSSIAGCLSCTDINTCELCKTGFYLGTDNKCRTCFSSNSGCQACAAITGGIQCLKCSAGFYLDSVTKLCAPCGTVGCKLCAELNPSDCITCDSLYYLSGTNCIKCGTSISGCSQCLDSANCITCDVGYYLDSDSKCQLCQDILGGCSKCKMVGTNFECEDCKSSYILDTVTKTCKTCFSVLEGCTYCVNQTQCISCANGYFKDSSTDLCRSCTEQPGCLLCSNEMTCEYCSPSYFLEQTSQKCIKCSTVIPFCLTCLESTRCLSCQSGYFVNDKFQCQQVTVTATQKVNGVKLITEYVSSQTLGHTLFVKNDQYQNIGYNLTGQCELFLTDYNQLTATKKIVQVQLKIKDIKWIGPNQIKFYTDNPTSLTKDSMVSLARSAETIQRLQFQGKVQQHKSTPRLLTGTGVGNFKVSLQMSQQAVNTILPNIYQTGNLILDYSLNEPEFYISYLKYQGSSAASYSIFGYVVTCVLLLNFIYKTYKMTPKSEQKHHYTGEIISHVLALKSISLFHYPITYELYYFCYGFMLVDLPWLNYQIGPILAQRSDYVPTQLVMYFYNLNLASTYLLSLILSAVLLSLRFIINKNNEFARTKYTKLIYSIFMFGMIYAGSLSLQGAIFNPIQKVSVNGLFYLLGILGYIVVFIEMVYSINKDKNELYKVRIFIKASLLSIGHLNPIIVVSVAIITDILLIILQYVILQTNVAWNKFWLANHLLLDLSLALMFLLPNSAISLYSTFGFVIIVVVVQIALNAKLMSYMESKYPKQNNLNDIVHSHRKRQKNKNQGFFGKNDSLQTFMDQKEFGKLGMWNNEGQFNSLHGIAVQDQRVDMTKKQFYQSRETKYSSFFDLKNLNKNQKSNENEEQNGNKNANKGRRVPKQVKEVRQNKRMTNLFRVQNSSSSSPTQESVNSNEDKEKKKSQPNFIRASNKVPLRDKKRIIPFQ